MKDTSGVKKALQATATASGAIQELSREERISSGMVNSKAWQAWFDVECEIEEGDVITDQSNGRRYQVTEINIREYGINQHKQALLLEYNA